MLKRIVLLAAFATIASLMARAQDISAAYRPGKAQVGVGYTNAASDEFQKRIGGISIFGNFDFLRHVGVEAEVHLLTLQNPNNYTQSSYEAGLRYYRNYGKFEPYLKGMAGVGSNTYARNQPTQFTDSFNMVSLGGGVTYSVRPKIGVRADFEWQDWTNYPPNVLNPTLFTVGVVYRVR